MESIPLGALIAVHGGISQVARALGVSHTPLSRHVRTGEPTLGAAALERLYVLLGVTPNGRPRPGLHVWEGRPDVAALRAAIAWAYPAGAEMAAAPWSLPPTSVSELVARVRMRREIALLTDGRVWTLLNTPAGRLYRPEELGPGIMWRGGSHVPQALAITGTEPSWQPGSASITLEDSQRAWEGRAAQTAPSWTDAVNACIEVRLTPHEVIAFARSRGRT